MDVVTLGSLTLPDPADTKHALADLWRDQPAVVAFLRHFG